jgi:serine/threonine-protein kinase RsbW
MQNQQLILAKISINCSLQELKVARSFINEQLQLIHVSDNDINMITLSVDEVCANLIIHALKLNLEDKIEITLFKENNGIRVNILDHGISFNPVNFKEKSLEVLVKEKKKGGLGLILVNKIMDKIDYHIEETYNVCSMFKNVTLA